MSQTSVQKLQYLNIKQKCIPSKRINFVNMAKNPISSSKSLIGVRAILRKWTSLF